MNCHIFVGKVVVALNREKEKTFFCFVYVKEALILMNLLYSF